MKRITMGFIVFLFVLVVLVAGFVFGLFFQKAQASKPSYDSLTLMNYVNQGRQSNGIQPLYIDQTLCDVASKRREFLVEREQWSHDSFDLFSKSQDKFPLIGENLAKGYSSDIAIYTNWQLSQSHNTAMNNPRFVAGCISMDYTYVVFLMGGY